MISTSLIMKFKLSSISGAPKFPVLLLDSDSSTTDVCLFHLEKAGFSVVILSNWLEASEYLATNPVCLIVLEIDLPGRDGIEVCRTLKNRESTAEIPIIFLTARSSSEDRILGLEAGAEDFMGKPVSPRELMLRVQQLIKRTLKQERSECIYLDELKVDLRARMVYIADRRLNLTDTEFRLLAALCSAEGTTCSRADLITAVWGETMDKKSRSLDTHVCRLKDKLEHFASRIQTVHSRGYALQ